MIGFKSEFLQYGSLHEGRVVLSAPSTVCLHGTGGCASCRLANKRERERERVVPVLNDGPASWPTPCPRPLVSSVSVSLHDPSWTAKINRTTGTTSRTHL